MTVVSHAVVSRSVGQSSVISHEKNRTPSSERQRARTDRPAGARDGRGAPARDHRRGRRRWSSSAPWRIGYFGWHDHVQGKAHALLADALTVAGGARRPAARARHAAPTASFPDRARAGAGRADEVQDRRRQRIRRPTPASTRATSRRRPQMTLGDAAAGGRRLPAGDRSGAATASTGRWRGSASPKRRRAAASTIRRSTRSRSCRSARTARCRSTAS